MPLIALLMNRWAWVGIAVLLAGGAGALGAYKLTSGRAATLQAEKAALTAAVDALRAQREKDAALLTRRAQAAAAAAREAAALRSKLSSALAANREWAAQPVPKEIQDALAQP